MKALKTVKIPNNVFNPQIFLLEIGVLQNMTWNNKQVQTEDQCTELIFHKDVWAAVELVFQRMYKKDINEFVV